MANEPNAIAVRGGLAASKSARDLAEQLKADPQSITTSVGSTRGGPSHMMMVQLAKLAGADARKLKIVTFSGSAESVTNLLGGHIQVISSSVDALVPHHKSGAMRILGVATAQRPASLPGVPTFREQGYDIVVGNWTAIMGPKGLAPAQIAYWEDLLERTFKHPAWQGMLEADALEADFRKSQPMRELLARDDELERRMLTELGMVKPDARIEVSMPANSTAWSLTKAALNGAVVGPLVLLMNLYFQGRLATTPIADLAMMLVGGAGGGAVLFLAIALFVRFLNRQASK